MDMDKELNCSEGARMLIERMQTHPKDFKYNGRFSRIADQIRGNTPVGYADMSDRDRSALTAAYEKHIMEPSLTEYVVDEIFNGDKRRQEQQEQQNLASQYTSALAASMSTTKNTLVSNILSGVADPRNTYGNAIYNPAQGKQLWKYEEEEKALQLSIMDKIRRKLKGEPK
jgi:hypothetical protein